MFCLQCYEQLKLCRNFPCPLKLLLSLFLEEIALKLVNIIMYLSMKEYSSLVMVEERRGYPIWKQSSVRHAKQG